jgi:hypothetical protein
MIGAALAAAIAVPAAAQGVDLFGFADSDANGQVTPEEWAAFSEQGWGFLSGGADKVKVADLDPFAQAAFSGITPDAEGFVTQQMYLDAIPVRFEMTDTNDDGLISPEEMAGPAG